MASPLKVTGFMLAVYDVLHYFGGTGIRSGSSFPLTVAEVGFCFGEGAPSKKLTERAQFFTDAIYFSIIFGGLRGSIRAIFPPLPTPPYPNQLGG